MVWSVNAWPSCGNVASNTPTVAIVNIPPFIAGRITDPVERAALLTAVRAGAVAAGCYLGLSDIRRPLTHLAFLTQTPNPGVNCGPWPTPLSDRCDPCIASLHGVPLWKLRRKFIFPDTEEIRFGEIVPGSRQTAERRCPSMVIRHRGYGLVVPAAKGHFLARRSRARGV